MPRETVVVAGAAGLIGSHLSETLLKQDNRVIGIDNFITGSRDNIEWLSKFPSFEFVENDISQPIDLKTKVNSVYDFACPASPPEMEKLQMEILRAGCFGVYFLLELARAKNAKFIFSSSSEVYGDPVENPQREEYNGNVYTTGVRSIYDEGKRYGESMVSVYRRKYGLSTRIVRIFNTYGERMRLSDPRAIPTFIVQALLNKDLTIFGDGTQTRSPQYVTDLVDGILKLAQSNVDSPVNIGNPVEMTVIDLAQTIIKLADSKSNLVYGPLPQHDPKVRKPDITRAKQLLGWEPKIPPEEGLKRTIEGFRAKLNLNQDLRNHSGER